MVLTMRLLDSLSCLLDKSNFNNLINKLLRRSEIGLCDLLRLLGSPETVLRGEMLVIDPNECLKIVLYVAVIIG